MRELSAGHLMPLCVFDIFPDGTTQVPSDTALTGPGAYRWWHFDISNQEFPEWATKRLAEIPAQALMQPETRPRCDQYEDGLILNLRGINLNEGQDTDQMVSVRMWVEDRALITVRVRRVFAIEEIRTLAEAQKAPATPAAFLEALINRLTTRIQTEVQSIGKLTQFYEDDLDDQDTKPPKDLPDVRRSVIRLRRYLEPQRAALKQLAVLDLPLIPAPDGLRLRELANRTTIAVEELDALKERLITVQEEHDQHVANQQARHGYVLSLAAAVFLPLGFLTGLFGVNIAGMPGMQSPNAFWILCAGMIGLAFVMLGILRLFRWF